MTERDDALLDRAIRAHAQRQLESDEPHLSTELIQTHLEHRLADSAAERVLEHLSACPDCARLTVEMAEFLADEATDSESNRWRELRAEDWRSLQSRLQLPGDDPTPLAAPRPSAPRSQQRWLRPLAALTSLAAAAMVVIVVRGQGEITLLRESNVSLAQELAATRQELDRQQEGFWANDAVVEPLLAAPRSNGPSPPSVRLEEGQGLVLVLTPETRELFADYRIEVEDANNEPILSLAGLTPRPLRHQFTLRLPKSKLPAGRYSATLFGGSTETWEPIGRFVFEIEP